MHNTLTRAQNVFGFFTSVAAALACAIALLSLASAPTATSLTPGSLTLRNVQVVKGRAHYASPRREEYAHVRFDLDADLSGLFTWNTKQVFLYVTASYPSSASISSSDTLPSRAIVWDAILAHPLAPAHHNVYTKHLRADAGTTGAAPGLLRLSSQRPKYQITDPSGRLAGAANATLELAWNVQPWVGALTWASGAPAARAGLPLLRSQQDDDDEHKAAGGKAGRAGRRHAAGAELAGRALPPWWDAAVLRPLRGVVWRQLPEGVGRTPAFALPPLRGKEGEKLKTEKGGEANRGSPA